MGTRADFYVGRGETAEWLGSIAWDGYPDGIPEDILKPRDIDDYRTAIGVFVADRKDGTTPEMGWPWPWEDSNTTDYAYAFDDGKVWANCFGGGWFDPLVEHDDEAIPDAGPTEFPRMTPPANPFHERSGVFVISS